MNEEIKISTNNNFLYLNFLVLAFSVIIGSMFNSEIFRLIAISSILFIPFSLFLLFFVFVNKVTFNEDKIYFNKNLIYKNEINCINLDVPYYLLMGRRRGFFNKKGKFEIITDNDIFKFDLEFGFNKLLTNFDYNINYNIKINFTYDSIIFTKKNIETDEYKFSKKNTSIIKKGLSTYIICDGVDKVEIITNTYFETIDILIDKLNISTMDKNIKIKK